MDAMDDTAATAVDPTLLRDGYRALLDAAATVASSGGPVPLPPPGEWNAEQILAHVAVLSASMIAAVSNVACGAAASYDSRLSADAWTLERVIARAGGGAGLRERVRVQGEALCALSSGALGGAEADTPVPTLLVSGGTLMVDQPVPLRDLLTGFAEQELPGHARQLLALLPANGTRSGTRSGTGSGPGTAQEA